MKFDLRAVRLLSAALLLSALHMNAALADVPISASTAANIQLLSTTVAGTMTFETRLYGRVLPRDIPSNGLETVVELPGGARDSFKVCPGIYGPTRFAIEWLTARALGRDQTVRVTLDSDGGTRSACISRVEMAGCDSAMATHIRSEIHAVYQTNSIQVDDCVWGAARYYTLCPTIPPEKKLAFYDMIADARSQGKSVDLTLADEATIELQGIVTPVSCIKELALHESVSTGHSDSEAGIKSRPGRRPADL